MEVPDPLSESWRDLASGDTDLQGDGSLNPRRIGWALGGLLLALLVPSSPAVADDGACPAGQACLLVEVTGSIQETLVVTGDDLDLWHDLTDPPYRTHAPGGTQNEPRPRQATSVPAILQNLPTPVPLGKVTFVGASAFDGAHATRLIPGQLGSGGYQDGASPGFFADGDRQLVRFARPMRSDDDLNYEDVWTSRSSGQSVLEVHTTGAIVTPRIVASSTAVNVGDPVDLSVAWDGPAPPGPSYAWNLGDGTASTDPTPNHVWQSAGSYYVTVDVRGSDTSEGAASPVLVRVGPKPPPTNSTPPGTGAGGVHNPVTGPVSGQGTTTGGTNPPGSGTAGSSTGTGSETGTTGSTPTDDTPPKKQPKKPRSAIPSGTRVAGTLLVADISAATPNSPKAAPVSAASARAVPGLTQDWRWLWLLLLPGSLMIGGASQSRWLYRRLPVLPWRRG